jgi:hypothetical protein
MGFQLNNKPGLLFNKVHAAIAKFKEQLFQKAIAAY